jgi:predicted P-loop ATPase
MKKVKFNDQECDVLISRYQDTNIAIQLYANGFPYAMASTNDPELELESDQVLIKDYSENKGMVKALQEAGIVQPLYPYPVGFFGANAWVCELISKS